MSLRLAFGISLCAVFLAGSGGASAAPLMSPMCDSQNLIAGKLPSERQDIRGSLWILTDGAVAPEGAQWDSPVAAVFETAAGSVTYDLGQEMSVSAFYVQADANDSYKIMGSLDGRSFRQLTEVDIVQGVHGLRQRAVTIPPTAVRFVRVGEGLGDNAYSISEFAVYCQPPSPFPPQLRVVDAPQATIAPQPWHKQVWNNESSARFEMVLAFLGLALLGWNVYLRVKGRPDEQKKTRDRLLMALGVLSLGVYFNFGAWHFWNRVHIWDTFHYYIGSKYFDELSYDRLYECVAVADAEDPRLTRRVELRKIMNLRTNVLGSTKEILAHPERCKEHFSPERWASFKHDVAYFRNNHGVKRWEEAQTDHGFNGTPVWNIVGTTIANLAPASPGFVGFLTWIDVFLVIGMSGMIWWAFGWRVLCVALLAFATNFPSRYYWTGGSYLRWDWLFYLVGGICLVKKERFMLGGFFLAYSTLLRLFPGFLFIGPAMLVVQGYLEHRKLKKLDRRLVRFISGAALAVALLVPVSLVTSGGVEGYRMFVQNSVKHSRTPLTNYMGLRTVIAYRPSEIGRLMRTDRLEDPWQAWKDAKLNSWANARWLYAIVTLGFMGLLWFAVRGRDLWTACALSAMTIAVGPSELTCYYYAFIAAVALLYAKREEVGAILAAVTGLTGFIDWAPTRFLPNVPPWNHLRMPTWLDEQYTWMSVVTLLGFAAILYLFGFDRRSELAAAPVQAGALPPERMGSDGPTPEQRPAASPSQQSSKRRRRGRGGRR